MRNPDGRTPDEDLSSIEGQIGVRITEVEYAAGRPVRLGITGQSEAVREALLRSGRL